MSNSIIKLLSLRFSLMVMALCCLLLSDSASAQSRKEYKQQADELSYQQAGGETVVDAVSMKYDENGKWIDPNAVVVRAEQQQGQSNSRLTPVQQKICELTNSKAELQERVDQLGEALQGARGGKARKITAELEELANQIALLDLKLDALPKEPTIVEAYSDNKPFHNLVDSLVDHRIEEKGYFEDAHNPTVVESLQVVYHVQLAVTTRPNIGAFSNISGVEMTQRPDGKYAYYYGNYSNYAQAQSANKRIKATSQYRDAFVVALRGTQRISIKEAAQLVTQ